MVSYDVAVIVGSIRKESTTRRLVNALAAIAPSSIALRIVEIKSLPFYSQDLESKPTQAEIDFRNAVASADAVLFATPEYNRSIPGVLKNAVDIGSRPYGHSIWNGKPAAVMSVSPGALAAFGANHHLRQSLVFLNMPTLAQPEAYIGNAAALVDETGKITNKETREFLLAFLTQFATWISNNTQKGPKTMAA